MTSQTSQETRILENGSGLESGSLDGESRSAKRDSWIRRHRLLVVIVTILLLLIYNTAANIFSQAFFGLPSTTTVVLVAGVLIAVLWWPSSFPTQTSRAPVVSHDEVRNQQREIEADLDKIDTEGIGKVIRLSRLELDRFYNLTIGQTQGSYRWALLASWLGLLVIAAGVLELFGIITPLSHSKSGSSLAGTPAGSIVTISAGALVEVVSVLFLSVYRSVNQRFSYFYDRQMHLYGILMACRISAGMKASDTTKKEIIKEITNQAWDSSVEKNQGRRGVAKMGKSPGSAEQIGQQ